MRRERMTPLDATFLQAEDAQPNSSLAIASVALFSGPAPTLNEFRAHLASRVPLIARYRQKLRQIPFDLAAPVWVDDPAFDIDITRPISARSCASPPGAGSALRAR